MTTAKRAFYKLGQYSGGFHLCRMLSQDKIRILGYHGVDDYSNPILNHDGLQISPALFTQQIEHIAKTYQVVTLEEIAEALIKGTEIPPLATCITFDDGYKNNLVTAAPILAHYNVPATFFITTDYVSGHQKAWWYEVRSFLSDPDLCEFKTPDGKTFKLQSLQARIDLSLLWEHHLRCLAASKRDEILQHWRRLFGQPNDSPYPFMTWNDIRTLRDMGHEIAPHTVSHAALNHETDSIIVTEVKTSIRLLEEHTGTRPLTFAYPHGEVSDIALQTLESEQIKAAVTTLSGMNDSGSNPFMLKRWNIKTMHAGPAFISLISGYSDCFNRIRYALD